MLLAQARLRPGFAPLPVVGVLLLSACPAPIPYEPCANDAQCPKNYICEVSRQVCLPGPAFDAAALADSADWDAAVIDATGVDGPAVDATGIDRQVTDASTPDSGPSDLHTPDRLVLDARHADVMVDDHASFDVSAIDSTLVNHPPVAEISGPEQLFPGEEITLQAQVTDPDVDEQHSYSWTLDEHSPAGVSLSEPTSDRVTLLVDRSIYALGNTDTQIEVSLTVEDRFGESDLATHLVTILDERGPFVVADSVWEGQGYAETELARFGFCGAPRHACNNIADAQANLAERIIDRSDQESVIRVWEGTYILQNPLVWDHGFKLECGYQDWQGGVLGTPSTLRFNNAFGLIANNTDVSISHCDIQLFSPAISGGGPNQECAAIKVFGASAHVQDSFITGNKAPMFCSDSYAIWFDDLGLSGQQLVVKASDVDGGIGLNRSVGVQAIASKVELRSNARITGGQGDQAIGAILTTPVQNDINLRSLIINNQIISGGVGGDSTDQFGATGLIIAQGNPQIENNNSIQGGSGNTAVGLILGEAAAGTSLDANNFVGLPSGAAQATNAIGMLCQATLTSHNNSFFGAQLSEANQCLGAKFNRVSINESTRISVNSSDDLFVGGSCSATTALHIQGLVLANLLSPVLHGSNSNTNPSLANGLLVEGAAEATLSQAQIYADPFDGADTSIGVNATSDQQGQPKLTMQNGEIIAHAEQASFGLTAYQASHVELNNVDISAGFAKNSTAVALSEVDQALIFSSNLLASGDNSDQEIYGLVLENCPNAQINDNHITAFSEENTSPLAKTCVGFDMGDGCYGSRIFANTIVANSATLGSIAAVLTQSQGDDGDPVTLFFSNNLVAKRANESTVGLLMQGTAGAQLRVIGNNIMAETSTLSRGVWLAWEQSQALPGDNFVGVLAGNIIGITANSGAASDDHTFNIVEQVDCTPYSPHRATLVSLNGGADNNLWPQGSVLLRKATTEVMSECINDTDSLDFINDAYGETYGHSLSEDPLWREDLPHILDPASPVLGQFLSSETWAPADLAVQGFTDIDGEARPLEGQDFWSIGCDEYSTH